MYFESRAAAGQQLADQLLEVVADQPAAVIALSSGGVAIGIEIAERLNCDLTFLLSDEVRLPQEPVPIGGVTSGGSFSFNSDYTDAQLAEFTMEYHNAIEQGKLTSLRRLHREANSDGLIDKSLLENKHIILASDGLIGGFELGLVIDYLKPINHGKLIVATPFADVPAVDKMHIFADKIICLNVLANFISISHYYDHDDNLERQEAAKLVQDYMKQRS